MKALTSVNEVCMSVHADAPVKVEDNFCETIKDSPTSISFQDYPSTISNEHAKSTQSKLSVTIEMRKEDYATEQTREAPIGKTQTLTIIITALSVILLVILLSWVKARISRMLEQRTQRKLMRPTFPGLSFSERMRARRGGRSRTADSEV
ncbi:uncharacterized protein LOC132728684 [Ruditapes philippinarum]|uniref:uncharacterized protein LOC132728684 n=1 Tax=Ruditapes philippinarum TaxID=129788 RepID=UPI00295C1023|nr:uncharacterized protein LOC132728684 [Ruditapes philippinarum]